MCVLLMSDTRVALRRGSRRRRRYSWSAGRSRGAGDAKDAGSDAPETGRLKPLLRPETLELLLLASVAGGAFKDGEGHDVVVVTLDAFQWNYFEARD
jgi:hypothetical protein